MTEDNIVYKPGSQTPLHTRFRGFLPVVVDVETGGFNFKNDALLEIAAIIIAQDDKGRLYPEPVISTHVIPFEGANICLLYTSPSPRDRTRSRMPSSA